MEAEKKVTKVTRGQIESWIRNGVTKDKGSPNYDAKKGSLLEHLNCKQSAIKNLFKSDAGLEKLYRSVNYKKSEKSESIELVDLMDSDTSVDPVSL